MGWRPFLLYSVRKCRMVCLWPKGFKGDGIQKQWTFHFVGGTQHNTASVVECLLLDARFIARHQQKTEQAEPRRIKSS